MWKFILLQLHVLDGLTLIFSSFSTGRLSEGGEEKKEKSRDCERNSDTWINTGFVHLPHAYLIWSCQLGDTGTDSTCQPSLLYSAFCSVNGSVRPQSSCVINEFDLVIKLSPEARTS